MLELLITELFLRLRVLPPIIGCLYIDAILFDVECNWLLFIAYEVKL